MKCPGAGQPPKTLYKAVRHYQLRNGRNHQTSGQGECAHCGGCHAVKAKAADGTAYVVHHKDIRTCTETEQRINARRKQFWGYRYEMNRFSGDGWQPVHNWSGTATNSISVVETPTWTNSSTSVNGNTWWSQDQRTQTFRVELHSSTPYGQTGNYLFQFNDQTIVGPQERMTLVVDYATWSSWNNSITVSNNARIEANQTWHQWTLPTGNVGLYNGYSVRPREIQAVPGGRAYAHYTAPREDPAAATERRRREAERLFERVEATTRARDEARQTAHQMLLTLLTPEQRKEYQERRHFHVRGSNGTLYRIMHGSSGNIRQVLSETDEGRGLHAFCAHPRMSTEQRLAAEVGLVAGHLPHEDAMIAQLLALTTDEDQFLAVANRHW